MENTVNIRIMSRNDASAFIQLNPNYPIIAIGESDNNAVNEKIVSKAKNCLRLIFDDTELVSGSRKSVEDDQIRQAIEWAKDKDDLIVACAAGISRSSAIAYLVGCSKADPEEAIKILDLKEHQPNQLVIYRGIKVLGNKKIEDVFQKWVTKFYEQYA